MGINMFMSQWHKMDLVCGLVAAGVSVGVHPVLPIKGFDMVLGNDPAGCRALADVAVSAINRAMSRTDVEDVQERKSRCKNGCKIPLEYISHREPARIHFFLVR